MWSAVDAYLGDMLIGSASVLEAVLAANAAAGLPAHDVTPNQAKLLMLLARMVGARSVLEIGTLGAYSTIWLARGLPADGQVVTLEADPHHAAVARSNLDRAALPQQIDLRVGPALETLPALVDHPAAPFDMVFIDANKPSHPHYLRWALRLTRPGSLIVGDNVVRDGQVLDAASPDARVQGVRAFLELLASEPRLDATALQTVGSKGWDGFALAVVTG